MKKFLKLILAIVLSFSIPQVNYTAFAEEPVVDPNVVHVTVNTLGDSYSITNGDTITAQFSFEGNDTFANRKVTVRIPQGLRLLSATGLNFDKNGTMSLGYFSESEKLSWQQPVLSNMTMDTTPSVDGISYGVNKEASGEFVYYLKEGVSGTLNFEFQADELLYDYSGNQSIGEITATIEGETSSDTSSTDISISPVKENPSFTLTGDANKEVNKKVGMIVNLAEDFPLGGMSSDETKLPIYEVSFKLTYPTGGIPAEVAGFTNSAETNNGDGTSSIIVTKDTFATLTNGEVLKYWNGGITYPTSDFNSGDTVVASVSEVTWKTLCVKDDGTIGTTIHSVTDGQSLSTKLGDIIAFDPYYSYVKKDWEQYYNEDVKSVVLTEAYNYYKNSGTSYTPVRFRVDCDSTKDNVNKIELFVPPTTPGNSTVTKVVYKYTDGSEVVWKNTDGTPMPGEISNNRWQQAGSNNDYITLTAETGKYFEYAYVEVDQIYDFGFAGHNNKVYGLPIHTTPGGDYSNHVFSTSQYNETTGEWDVKEETVGTGFRYKIPTEFKITDSARDGADVKYAGNATADDVSLAKFAYVNTSGGSSDNPILWSLACDTVNDKTSTVWFPLPYELNISDSMNLVESVKYTYEDDPTVYEWRQDSGEPFPFGTGKVTLSDNNANISVTNKPEGYYAILEAEEGKHINTVDVVYTKWSDTAGGGFANVWGRPVSVDASAPKSQHVAVMSTLKSDGSVLDQLSTNTQGFKWGVLVDVQVRSIGNFNGTDGSIEGPNLANVDIDAGTRATLKFQVVGNPVSQMTIALLLPNDLHLVTNSLQWRFQKPNGFPIQDRVIGGTLVTERPATQAELDQAGFDEGTVYIYNATNQDAATNYASGLRRYYSYITFDVNVDPLAADQTIKWSQISYFSTNQEGIVLRPIDRSVENVVASTPIDGLGGEGVYTMIGDRTRTITIHKSPILSISNGVSNSDGDYKTYTSNEQDVVPFTANETGSIKLNVVNTVEGSNVSSYSNYVFIPIGDGTFLSKESGFDLQVGGNTILNYTEGDLDDYEIRYLTLPSSQSITASNTNTLFNAGATTFDATTNFVAVRLDRLHEGKSVEIEIPVKAPDIRTTGTVYDQASAISIYYFKGTDRAVYNASSDGTGSIRMSYRNVIYDVVFDSNYGSAIDSQEIQENEKATMPENPTRNGYEFSGWYTDNTTFAHPYDFDTPVTEDTTLYAKWTEKAKVTIHYEVDSAIAGSILRTSETVKPVSGTTVGSTVTVNPGYTFIGWYRDTDLVSTNLSYIPSKSDTSGVYEAATYTAKFIANTDTAYTVEYWMHDVTGEGYSIKDDATENLHGTTATTATVPSKTFDGFTYQKTTYESTGKDTSETELSIAGDGSLVVKVYYTRKTYTVKFNDPLEGGTLTADPSVKNQNVIYGGSPIGEVQITEADPDAFAWLGYQWVSTDDHNVTTSGTIDKDEDITSFVVTGNTVFTPYFARIPFVAISTTGNGFVAVEQGTTIPTTITKTSDKYEWPFDNPPADDAALAFVAAEHYRVASITVSTPNGADHDTKTIPVTKENSPYDFSDILEHLVDTTGVATITLETDDRGNVVGGSILMKDRELSVNYVLNYEKI